MKKASPETLRRRAKKYEREFDAETLALMVVYFEEALMNMKYKVFVRAKRAGK